MLTVDVLPKAKVRLDGRNDLVLISDDRHFTGAEGSPRASLVFDGRDGDLYWSSRERSGTTAEWAGRPLVAILSIVGDDPEACKSVIGATRWGKRLALERIAELRRDGQAASLRVAGKLQAAVDGDWLRIPRQAEHR